MTPAQLESLRIIQGIAQQMIHSGVTMEMRHGQMIMDELKKIKEEEGCLKHST